MLDLLELSPQILLQQLCIKPAHKIKICELVTSDKCITPHFLKSMSRLFSNIEITFLCSDPSFKSLDANANEFGGIKITHIDCLDAIRDKYFDIFVGNLSSCLQTLPKIMNADGIPYKKDELIQLICKIAKNISLFLDKSFLHAQDYVDSRNLIKTHHIKSILDFNKFLIGKSKFEVIHLTFNTDLPPNNKLQVIFTPKKEILIQNQEEITNSNFPNWLLYLNDDFRELFKRLQLDIFNVERDRQINNSMLTKVKSVNAHPVLKAKHLSIESNSVVSEFNNDPFYIEPSNAEKLSVRKFLNEEDVFLCPNMTPHIRIFRKPMGFLMNSSVCILSPKSKSVQITEDDILFWRSNQFIEFYKIARNRSQLNLNIDKSAAFYFGLLRPNRHFN